MIIARGKREMHFTAICAYPGKEAFAFYSVDFIIEHWSDLEKEGQRQVAEAWAKISPHPAPDIVEFQPGSIHYVPNDS